MFSSKRKGKLQTNDQITKWEIQIRRGSDKTLNIEPKEKWYKTDIEKICDFVLSECQKLNPEIKLGKDTYSVLSFSIYLEGQGTKENQVITESIDFRAVDAYTGYRWEQEKDTSKHNCRGLQIILGRKNHRRINSKHPDRLKELIPEIVKHLNFKLNSELTRLITKCECNERFRNVHRHKRDDWKKLLDELGLKPEHDYLYNGLDKDFDGEPLIKTGSQEITLDAENYSKLRFTSSEEINFQKFNVNITNIPKTQLIKILKVMKN